MSFKHRVARHGITIHQDALRAADTKCGALIEQRITSGSSSVAALKTTRGLAQSFELSRC